MFDEDLFNVFNETSSSAEKPGSQRASGSVGDDGTKSKYRDDEGSLGKTANKRYEYNVLRAQYFCTSCTGNANSIASSALRPYRKSIFSHVIGIRYSNQVIFSTSTLSSKAGSRLLM